MNIWTYFRVFTNLFFVLEPKLDEKLHCFYFTCLWWMFIIESGGSTWSGLLSGTETVLSTSMWHSSETNHLFITTEFIGRSESLTSVPVLWCQLGHSVRHSPFITSLHIYNRFLFTLTIFFFQSLISCTSR